MQGQDSVRRIRRQADRLRTLDVVDARQPAFLRWFAETKSSLDEIFGAGKGPAGEFQLAMFQPSTPSKYDPDSDWRAAYEKGISIAYGFFDSVIRDLLEDPGKARGKSTAGPASAAAPEPVRPSPGPRPGKTREADGIGEVLVFCGADEALGQQLSRWLAGAGARPAVAGEPSAGGSPLDRLDGSEPAFGVVVLGASERAGSKAAKREERGPMRPSPLRMFELGLLLGRLGTKKVCALLPPGVELAFSIPEAAVIPLDGAGTWKWGLASAMAAAGLPVDPADAARR